MRGFLYGVIAGFLGAIVAKVTGIAFWPAAALFFTAYIGGILVASLP